MKRNSHSYLLQWIVISIFLLSYASDSFAQMVGNIPGELSADGTGGATYTIPIECPPGVGMEPKISLVYNSQSGKGLAGWGWNIAGLSSIVRTSQISHFDNTVNKAITWTKADPLMLNGQRLIKEANSDTRYYLEGEPGTLVEAYSIQTWGPSYLKAFTKEGITMTFGNPQNQASYVKVYDNARTKTSPMNLVWNLVEVEDANGNYMTIDYISSLNSDATGNAIQKITYGKNKRTQNSNLLIVSFEYEKRPDEIQGYISGKESLQQLRLKTIKTIVNNETQKEYRLTYRAPSYYATGISSLYSIDLYNRGVKLLKPLFFEYGSGKETDNEIDIDSIRRNARGDLKSGLRLLAIDTDGDGYCELRNTYVKEGFPDRTIYTYFERVIPNGQGFPSDASYRIGVNDWDTDEAPTHLFGDFDGDGITDNVEVFHEGDISSGTVFRYVGVKIQRLSDGTDLLPATSPFLVKRAPLFSIGKCVGLPFSSLVALKREWEPNSGMRYFYTILSRTETISQPDFSGSADFTIPGTSPIVDMEVVKLGSFDYWDDLFLTLENGNNLIVVNKQGTGNKYASDQIKNPGLKIGKDDYHQFVDINGDGLTDIVYRKKENDVDKWRLALNKGNYTFEIQDLDFITNGKNVFKTPNTIEYNDRDVLFFIDVNRDGLMDIVSGDEQLKFTVNRESNGTLHYTYSFDRTSWNIYLNTGNGFQYFSGALSAGKAATACLGDLLGNGNITWAYAKTDGKYVIKDFRFNSNQNLLTSVTNSMGVNTVLKYKAQTEEELNVTNTNDNGFVTSLQQYIGLGFIPYKNSVSRVFSGYDNGREAYSFRYGKPLVNWKYRGFSGYRYVEKRDERTGLSELVVSGFPATGKSFYLMLPAFKWTYRGTNYPDSIISKETYEYNVKSYTGQKGRFTIQPTKTIRKGYLVGETTVTEYNETFDEYNNVTARRTEAFNQVERHEFTYAPFGSWCKNKVTKDILTTTCTTDRTSFVRTSLFAYDSRGNLTESQKDYGNENAVITRYKNYDAYGHPLQIEEVTDSEYRHTNYTYTPSGRFVAAKTNPLDESVSYVWNEVKGLMTESADRTGTTLYTYHNNYDYLTKITYPTGLVESHSLTLDVTNPGGYYTLQTRTDLVGQQIKTYYDKYGREYASEKYSPIGGKKIRTLIEYYPDGRVHRISKPGDSFIYWETTYTYDKYGRVLSRKGLEDSTLISYGTNNALILLNYVEEKTSSGRVIRKSWNPAGQLAKVTTDGKTVQYTYSAGNRLKTSKPDGGTPIQLEYNLQGDRTKIIDPDAGTITSHYDGRGQLRWKEQKVHSNGATITTYYYYLPSGLLELKTIQNSITGATESTGYEYDSRKRLKKSYVMGGNHSCSYEYDAFDRPVKITEQIKGKTYITQNEYDIANRVSKVTYPSGYFIRNTYSYGYLKKVTDSAVRTLWELTECNDGGQVLKEKKNGVESQYSYHSETTRLTGIKANGIVDMAYTYYPKYNLNAGNLKTYNERVTNQQETYSYDNKDRLTNWRTPGDTYPGDNITYDASLNRISHKYDLLNQGHNFSHQSSTSNKLTSVEYTDLPMQSIEYTDFKRVKAINQNGESCKIDYGIDERRIYTRLQERDLTERYYVGDYEEQYRNNNSIPSKIHYIYGGNGLAAIYIQNAATGTLYSAYTDRQGSLIALANGSTVSERYAYDPWGYRRNPLNWQQKDSRTASGFLSYRGFGMHEHLDNYGLINMNSRMYEPYTCSFISPDPFIQAPENWLNYNRYAYCFYNPLKYTDPTGEWALFDDLFAAITGGVVNLFSNIFQGNIKGDFWTTVGKGSAAFGAGAVAGWGGLYPQFGGWVWGGAVAGATNAWLGGGRGEEILLGAGVGVISAGVGSAAGQWGAQHIGGIVINGTEIASPVLKGVVTGVAGGAVGGYAGGFTAGLIMTGDVKEAHQAGFKGAAFGAPIGGISGGVSAYRYATNNNINPWTGAENNLGNLNPTTTNSGNVTATDLGLEATMERISLGEKYPHVRDGGIFENRLDILPSKVEGYYKEYVHPTPGIKGPGIQRIVIGGSGELYYTPDHYKTFIKFEMR